MIGDFHFLRPWWLLAIVPALLLVWAIHRQADTAQSWRGIIADHLVKYLVSGGSAGHARGPLLVMGAAWLVAIVAVAGPTWKRERSPFANDVAALAVVLKVGPSMETEDVEPSRLTRSVQKIHDLLAKRGRSKVALIAYAGSAHVVMPATTDAAIIDTFAAAVSPKIMPTDGDVAADALRLADKSLAASGGGSILWITDSVAPEQAAPLREWRKTARSSLHVLAPLNESPELEALRRSVVSAGGDFFQLTADDRDISEISSASKFAAPAAADGDSRWQDAGYWMTPLAALLMLPFFRRGWMAPTAMKI